VKNTVQNIRQYFQDALKNKEFIIDKTGVKTIELIGASFIADEETIFGPVNYDYVSRELEWYQSMSLNVKDIPGKTPFIWEQVADRAGYINSNYGWCIWHAENGSQYEHVREELKVNPNSRRAVMIYTRPEMWYQYNFDGRSDFMCTNAVQYLIRDGALHAVVQMRSNDVVFGYRNDYAWQVHVLEKLAEELGAPVGDIYWNVGSLHVYERHFDLVRA
jgi:thymidylate synthase